VFVVVIWDLGAKLAGLCGWTLSDVDLKRLCDLGIVRSKEFEGTTTVLSAMYGTEIRVH